VDRRRSRLAGVDLSPLTAPTEALLATLAAYPETLARAQAELAPPDRLLPARPAANLHSFYFAERVLVDDAALKAARIALMVATRQVLRNGLALIGVSAPEKMERERPAAQ
jgi:arginyl-tRNA synthetase